MIARGLDRAHVAVRLDLDAHAFRRDALHERRHRVLHPRGILMRHQPRRNFRDRERRDDRFLAGTLIAAVHPVDLERRPEPHPLEREPRALPGELGDAELVRELRRIERERGDLGALMRRELAHVVVEPGDDDAPVCVFERGENLR